MDGEALKGSHDGADHVVAIQILRPAMIHGVLAHGDHERVIPRPCGHESERDDGLRVIGEKGIASDLFLHETRVRFVIVEGMDDIVTVGPGVGTGEVVIVAVGIGVVGHIQPMTRPVLAVARTV